MILPIIPFLICLASGVGAGVMAEKTHAYCECYRSDFDGKFCQEIKAEGKQGSCEIGK